MSRIESVLYCVCEQDGVFSLKMPRQELVRFGRSSIGLLF